MKGVFLSTQPVHFGRIARITGKEMSDMTVSSTGVDHRAGSQAAGEPDLESGIIEPVEKKARRKRPAEAESGEPASAAAIFQKNRQAKMRMAAELAEMGFSREAVGRILNLDFDHEKSL
jgi:hypothetical protein